MRHNPYRSFVFIQSLSVFILANKMFTKQHCFILSTSTQLLSKIFLNKYNKVFTCDLTCPYKYYDKMYYEEELDLFYSCIRSSISIMLYKTIYEINSTLLLRTYFKPPLNVCNNFLLQSHVECGRLLLLEKRLFKAFFNRCRNENVRCRLHINYIQKSYTNLILSYSCLLSYIIYSGCCHVCFCCVKSLTGVLWLKLSVLKLPGIHSKYNTH